VTPLGPSAGWYFAAVTPCAHPFPRHASESTAAQSKAVFGPPAERDPTSTVRKTSIYRPRALPMIGQWPCHAMANTTPTITKAAPNTTAADCTVVAVRFTSVSKRSIPTTISTGTLSTGVASVSA